MGLVASILLTVGLVVAAAALHFEALRVLGPWARRRGGRRVLLALVVALVFLHVGEIGLFSVGYWTGEHWLGLGRFHGEHA